MKLILFKSLKAEIEKLKKQVFNLEMELSEIRFDKDLKRQKRFKKLIAKDVVLVFEIPGVFSDIQKIKTGLLVGIKFLSNRFEIILKENNVSNVYEIQSKKLINITKKK